MKRADVEKWMKSNRRTQLDLVINKDDKLAIYCTLQGGVLKDYTNHVINRKADLWGYLVWENGKNKRVAFGE